MVHLYLTLFKTLQARIEGAPPVSFRSANTQALLAYLAVEGDRAHPRRTLAGLLWPDHSDQAAHHNLSQTMLYLRRAVGDTAPSSSFFVLTRPTIRLNTAGDVWSDVAAFTAHLQAAQAHAHDDLLRCPPCLEHLRTATALYQGPLLDEFAGTSSDLFTDWLLRRREEFRRQAWQALEQLAAYDEGQDDYARAAQDARQQLALDPLAESAHRRLMRVLALSGQRTAALAHYAACRRLLETELGLAPAPETAALAAQIRAGEITERRQGAALGDDASVDRGSQARAGDAGRAAYAAPTRGRVRARGRHRVRPRG